MVGLDDLRRRLSARAVRRHEDARVDRPRARSPGRSCCSWTSPSPRSTRSPASSSTTICSSSGRRFGWTVIFVTHSVFESVYLSERIVVMAARPGRVFADLADRRALPARRRFPHLGRLQRVLPARPPTRCTRRWESDAPLTAVEAEQPSPRTRRCDGRRRRRRRRRRASASARSRDRHPGRDARGSWSSSGRSTSPSPRCRTTSCRARCGSREAFVTDWPILGKALLDHAAHHLPRARHRAGRRRARWRSSWRSRAGSSWRSSPTR